MDSKSFISSGILELYVHGLATPEEVREVEEMAAKYPEVREELAAIQKTLEIYATAHRVQAPENLREKILQNTQNPPGRKGNSKNDPAAQNTSDKPSAVGASKTRFSAGAVAAWLLAVLFAVAAAFAYFFMQEAERMASEKKQAEARFEKLKKDCEQKQKASELLQEQFIVIRHWGNQTVNLKGTALNKEAFARIYWNSAKKTTFLDIINLPSPPAGKQYQLWAIVDKKPTDMGVFDVKKDSNTLSQVPFVEKPQAFAVTVEPEGGSASPTLDQMILIGSLTTR